MGDAGSVRESGRPLSAADVDQFLAAQAMKELDRVEFLARKGELGEHDGHPLGEHRVDLDQRSHLTEYVQHPERSRGIADRLDTLGHPWIVCPGAAAGQPAAAPFESSPPREEAAREHN
jgi:hypothetical protein